MEKGRKAHFWSYKIDKNRTGCIGEAAKLWNTVFV